MTRADKSVVMFVASIVMIMWNTVTAFHYLSDYWFSFPLAMTTNILILAASILILSKWAKS